MVSCSSLPGDRQRILEVDIRYGVGDLFIFGELKQTVSRQSEARSWQMQAGKAEIEVFSNWDAGYTRYKDIVDRCDQTNNAIDVCKTAPECRPKTLRSRAMPNINGEEKLMYARHQTCHIPHTHITVIITVASVPRTRAAMLPSVFLNPALFLLPLASTGPFL